MRIALMFLTTVMFICLSLIGCQDTGFKDPHEINVIKAKILPLGISRAELISEMKGLPLESTGLTEDGKYEIIYFETPPINSENVGALVEVSSQKVVGFQVYEWSYRALDGYVDVVRKVFAMTSDKAERLP